MGNRRKIVVVGTSNVGSAVVNKLADFQLASEIILIDLNQDKAWGEATDSSHATACTAQILNSAQPQTTARVKMLTLLSFAQVLQFAPAKLRTDLNLPAPMQKL